MKAMASSSSSYAITVSLRSRSSSLLGYKSCARQGTLEGTRGLLNSVVRDDGHVCISKNEPCRCCINNGINPTERKNQTQTLPSFFNNAPILSTRLSNGSGSYMRRVFPISHNVSFQRSFLSSLAETDEKPDSVEDTTPPEQSTKEQSSLPMGPAQVNPDNAASYVLMSNIYADGGKWDEVKRINEMRIQARAWKKPGKAWIECKSKVHEFIVGDETHQESTYIYDKIKKMRRHMNHTGYVPNVELVLQNRSNYDPFKPK